MRDNLFLFFVAVICFGLIFSVYQKETVLRKGRTFYMALRPVDPRSIIQGDYMELRYAANVKCLKLDGQNVGRGAEKDCDVKLKNNLPSSFFFQEGFAPIYSRAKYAVLKYDGKDTAVLYGLADENLKELKP